MADITDKLIKQSNGTQPLPTTLSAQKNSGASTASLNSATGWDTTTAKHIRMYKTKVVNGITLPDTNYLCYYKATLSGTTLSNITLVWSSTGSDQTFAIGDTVDLSYTSGYGEDLYSALSTHLDQDGTLKADSVDVTAVIKDSVITNAKLVNDTILEAKTNTKPSEFLSDFVVSGGVVAQSAGLVGTFSDIVYYISGVRYTKTGVANKTYTASKDTYVDINTSGTITYTEVSNGAASPALSASNIRVAKVVTNGSAITSVVQVGSDSLGNLIYNTDAHKQSAWRSWTPTWTNVTIGNAVVSAKYSQIGKQVTCKLSAVLGNTSSTSGDIIFTLPVLSTALPGTAGVFYIGGARLYDQSAAVVYNADVNLYSTTTASIRFMNAAGTYTVQGINTGAAPTTWATSDEWAATFTYEAA